MSSAQWGRPSSSCNYNDQGRIMPPQPPDHGGISTEYGHSSTSRVSSHRSMRQQVSHGAGVALRWLNPVAHHTVIRVKRHRPQPLVFSRAQPGVITFRVVGEPGTFGTPQNADWKSVSREDIGNPQPTATRPSAYTQASHTIIETSPANCSGIISPAITAVGWSARARRQL